MLHLYTATEPKKKKKSKTDTKFINTFQVLSGSIIEAQKIPFTKYLALLIFPLKAVSEILVQ